MWRRPNDDRWQYCKCMLCGYVGTGGTGTIGGGAALLVPSVRYLFLKERLMTLSDAEKIAKVVNESDISYDDANAIFSQLNWEFPEFFWSYAWDGVTCKMLHPDEQRERQIGRGSYAHR